MWLIPSVACMALAMVTAIGFADAMGGVLLVGAVCTVELLPRDGFVGSPWARHVFLFLSLLQPESPDLAANQLSLLALAAAFLAAAARLLKREERYL